jgi:hypothetical protein
MFLNLCFDTVSAYEAVVWIMDRIEDVSRVDNAIKLLQNMADKKFICHASGNESVPFNNGHHFYYIVQPNAPKTGWNHSPHFYFLSALL